MTNRRDARIIIPEGFSDDAIPALNNLTESTPERRSGKNSPLTQARKELDLTQVEMAEIIGVSKQKIVRYETGQINGIETARAIGKGYQFCPCCERSWRIRK